ncbi:MAG: ComF family protein [Verrucomicrobia bacterium]|nr:ComF family protein [Verrucomicrobiota bacterium]
MKSWLDTSLGFFYPNLCQICRSQQATAREGYVCAGCRQGVHLIKEPYCERCGLPYEGEITTRFECSNCREMQLHFKSARAAVAAEGVVLDVIHRYKYRRALWFEPFLAELLVRQAAPVLQSTHWNFIVPVPLHPLKQREREFNQARRLARHLSAATKIPLNCSLIKRALPTRTQTLLTRSERTANVRRAFAVNRGSTLDGERIVLVDDVLTTGATTSACAEILEKNGAGEVCVWTVARGT